MCPLRFILVFLSAILAGYFAWRTVRSSPEIEQVCDDYRIEKNKLKDEEQFNFKRVCLKFSPDFSVFLCFRLLIFIGYCLFLIVFVFVSLEMQMIQNGFWVFVDMASGRYLWRNMREMRKDKKAKS